MRRAPSRRPWLINNAAVRDLAPVAEANIAQWEALFAVNLMGAVTMCKAALPELRKAAGASVVNVASTYALVGRKGFGAYDAAKAALLSLTRTLAFEEAAHGVRVNAVCPGGTLTPFTMCTDSFRRKPAKRYSSMPGGRGADAQ